MSIGTRRHLVQVQRRTSGRDPAGQPLTTWENFGEADYADIRFLRGLEAVRGGAQSATAQVSIRLYRFRTDLSPAMRVLHEGVIYNIVDVLPDMQGHRYVDLPCTVIR